MFPDIQIKILVKLNTREHVYFLVITNPYLELLTPPVIKVPDLSGKILLFFLCKILQFVYPPYGREVLMRIPRRNY